MKRTGIIVILVLLTLIGIPTLLLNSSRFQQRLLDVATKEFKQRTGATMTVYDSEISLFKGIVFHVVRIQDAHSKPVLNAERIDVGLEVLPLFQNKIKIRNLRLIRANVYLSRLSPDSPLNIQPILDGLKSKKQKAKGWDIQLSSIVLRNCRVHYDVQSVPVSKKNYNWSHLDIQDISTRMAFRLIQKNHYSFWIYQLQAREKGGLRIDQLNTFGQITEKSLHLDHLSLHSGRTSLEIDGIKAKCKLFEKQATSLDSIILGSTNIRISLHPSDFAYFSSSLSNLDKQVDLSILMQGRFSNLNIKNLSINMQNMVTASGKFVVQNLRDLDNLNIQGSIKQLRINPAGMDYLAAHLTAKNFNSTILKNLGTLEYAGLVRTINKQWIVTGDFATAAGKINTDIHIGKKGFDFLYEGRIKSDSFKLQTLLPDNKDLGETAFDVSINGISKPGTGFSGKVDGSIPHIQYRGYDFLHLSLNGAFNKKGFEGEAKLDDLNGKLHFIGLIDFAETMPIYRFDLYAEGFNPFALGLMGYNNGSDFAFHLHSDFKGHHLDDLTGKLTVDSLSLYSGDQTFYLKHLELVMLRNLENQQILIASPILNGELWGNFQLSTLGDGIQGLLKSYFPSLSQKNYTGLRGNTYDFHLSVAPSPELFSILKLPFNLTETAEIRGFYNENTGKFRLRGDIPSMTYGKIPVESAGVLLENPQKEAKFLAFAEVGKDDKQMKINLDARGLNDFASIRFNMSNSAVKTYSGNLQGDVRFSRSAAGNLRADANLKPSSLMVNDSLWHILPTSLILEHKSLYVEAFELNHSDQFIKINGIASEKTSDTLHVALNSFSLDDIFALLPSTNRNLHLGGAITGKAQCVSLLGNPSMDADLQVKHFSFNHTLLGNLTAKSIWDNNLKAVVLDAAVYTESTSEKGSALLALSKGKFFPTKDSLYISVDGNRLPIGFLKPYLGKILDNMDGLASGKVQILGPTKHLAIYADAYMENTSFGVKMLHTRYTFSDSIHLTPSVIYFRNTLLRDKEGNTAVANGIIRHRYFKNMQTSIDIVGKNILAMDLPADPSAYFYGTAYGTGTVSVNGPQDDIVIDVNLKSEPKTNVTISFLDDSDVAEAGFIHFVQKKKRVRDDVDEEPFRKKRQPQPITTSSNVTVNLQLEATPAAELTLITDPNSGDEIRAKGSGALRCVISGKEDIQLFGRYDIESGSYKFIYENLLRRDFKIENGGSITFAGNPFAAQLDVTANYTVNAQLSDLLTSDDLARLNLNRSSIPVNCVLKLNGELQRPGITLDLAYPSADDELKRSITNVINTEDLLNQQLVFLMLFGRFNTTSYSTAQTNSSTNNMSTVWNTGISTLSSQLNRMINSAFGQTNMTFNLNYQNSSYDATTPGEWGVAMSGQFFNNRLTVNGNVGSRENLTAGSSNQFIGEFDADLKFKNSEKWRWKFFNRANDNRYLKSALNTQGAGISFKEDYNTIGELFRKMFGTRKDTTTTKKKTPKEKKQKTAQK